MVLRGETTVFGLQMTEQKLTSIALLQLYALLAAIADPVRKLSSVYTRIQSGAAALGMRPVAVREDQDVKGRPAPVRLGGGVHGDGAI